MCLPRQLLGSPTVGDTLETVTLGDSNNIDVLVLFEDSGDVNSLLEETMSEVDLVGNGSTVQLDLHEVSFLLAQAGLADLSVGKNADNSAVFADALKFTISRLATILSVLLGVAGEGLLLRSVPVLVEPSPEFFGEVGSPDGGEGAEAARSFNISNGANNDDWGRLHNGDGLNNLTFVHFCRESATVSIKEFPSLTGPWPLEVTNNVGHTSLVAHEGGQVHFLFGVILKIGISDISNPRYKLDTNLREGLDLSPMAGSTLPWKETQGSVARSFVLRIATFVSVPFFVLGQNLYNKPYDDYKTH